MAFPDGAAITLFAHENGSPDTEGRLLVESQRVPAGYFDVLEVLYEIVEDSGLDVTVQGWGSVDVRAGSVAFQLDLAPDRPALSLGYPYDPSFNLYANLAFKVIHQRIAAELSNARPQLEIGTPSQFGLRARSMRFDVDAANTDVFAVITRLNPGALGLQRARTRIGAAFALDVAPANADGSVDLDVPHADLTWVDAWPDTPTPGAAMLVRLTAPGSSGQYGYEIVAPSRF